MNQKYGLQVPMKPKNKTSKSLQDTKMLKT